LQEIVYKKEIQSNPELLPELDDFLMGIAKSAGLNEDKFTTYRCRSPKQLLMQSYTVNQNDPSKKSFYYVKVSDTQMTVIIKDEGKGFNIELVPTQQSQKIY
jgi:hypothetical protein